MSLAEFGFIQIEASCSRQSAICFNVIEEKLDLFFSPLATVLLKTVVFNMLVPVVAGES